MTLKYDSAFSPRDALEFCSNIRPLPTEGAVLPREGSRECRTLDAPAASRVEKNTRVSHHGHAGTPGIPRAMVLTVSFALSRVTGLCCHPRRRNLFHQLDASGGASGPHDFAVRKIAPSSLAPLASIASLPYVRDDRETPFCVGRDGERSAVICLKQQRKYFCEGDWTGSIGLIRFNKSPWARRANKPNRSRQWVPDDRPARDPGSRYG